MKKSIGRLAYLLFGGVLAGSGFALLWVYGSWQIALGVFLLIWANNIE